MLDCFLDQGTVVAVPVVSKLPAQHIQTSKPAWWRQQRLRQAAGRLVHKQCAVQTADIATAPPQDRSSMANRSHETDFAVVGSGIGGTAF